jgi:hypothetical protein
MIPLHRQDGTALVGIILLMLVLTFLGTSAFLNSTAELKINSNYAQSLRALYAAEAGLQDLLNLFRRNPQGFLQKKSGEELGFPPAEPQTENGPGTKYWMMDLHYDSQPSPDFAEVIIAGKEVGQNALCRIRATIYSNSTGGSDGVPAIFKIGLVTAGALGLIAPLDVRSSIHANQGYSIDPATVAEQLRTQQFSVTQSVDPGGADYQKALEVPLISEKGFQEYQLKAQNGGNSILSGSQNLTLKGDQSNRLIYVNGDVTLNSDQVSGLTLVATGSITLNGSVVLKEVGRLNSAFIAGGNILLNNFSELSAVFWSNQSIVASGAGKLAGTMVCQAPVSFGPGLQFERADTISDIYFPSDLTRYSFAVRGWSQL